MVVWRQWRTGPTRFANLRQRDVPHMRAAVTAGSPTGFWAMSRHAAVQQALPMPTSIRSASPESPILWSITLPNRRGTGPVCPVV